MLALKSTGGLPELTWAQIFTLMIPSTHSGPEGMYTDGFVTRGKVKQGDPCPVLWKTPIGEIWGRLEDELTLEFLLSEQLLDRVYDREPTTIKPGDVVFDIGSHLGTFTRFALHKGARQVIAFEPEPTNITCFERTFARELQDGSVVLVEAAAWHTPGSLTFQRNAFSATGRVKDQGWSSEWDTPVDDLVVQAVTIDDEVKRLGLDKIDLIKMDIEGAERHALAGARETLKHFVPKMVLCTYHRDDDAVVIPEIVLSVRPTYRIVQAEDHIHFYEPT